MRGRSARYFGFVALAAMTLAAGALAQDAPAAPAAPAAGDAPAASASAAPGPAYPAGATWSDKKDPKGSVQKAPGATMHHLRRPRHASSAEATLPGFEMLADGGSRVFVQLTKSVDVSEAHGMVMHGGKHKAKKGAASTLTYTLRGTDVLKRNNENALVTVHFNTPVASARLVGGGLDAHLVLSLRSNVTPTWKIEAAKNGAAILEIDFPKGDYLPASAASSAPAAGDQGSPSEPGDSTPQ